MYYICINLILTLQTDDASTALSTLPGVRINEPPPPETPLVPCPVKELGGMSYPKGTLRKKLSDTVLWPDSLRTC